MTFPSSKLSSHSPSIFILFPSHLWRRNLDPIKAFGSRAGIPQVVPTSIPLLFRYGCFSINRRSFPFPSRYCQLFTPGSRSEVGHGPPIPFAVLGSTSCVSRSRVCGTATTPESVAKAEDRFKKLKVSKKISAATDVTIPVACKRPFYPLREFRADALEPI